MNNTDDILTIPKFLRIATKCRVLRNKVKMLEDKVASLESQNSYLQKEVNELRNNNIRFR